MPVELCIKSDAKNGQQYQKWLLAVSEISSKIGIGFISKFLLKARVLFYCSLNTKFKGSENFLRFGTGGPSLFASTIVAKTIIFPRANNGCSSEKKISGEAICSRYERALSGF